MSLKGCEYVQMHYRKEGFMQEAQLELESQLILKSKGKAAPKEEQ